MDSKFVDQAVEGKLVKLGYSFPEKWQKRYEIHVNDRYLSLSNIDLKLFKIFSNSRQRDSLLEEEKGTRSH
jgi:hypothetical protein